MGFFSILTGAFTELRKNPVLFIPKMISVTIWLLPYLYLLQQAKFDLAAAQLSEGTLLASAAIFLLSPLWVVIDSMYPVLVEQQKRGKRLDFRAALNHVLGKFLKIFGLFLVILIATTLLTLPFTLLLAFGYAFLILPALALGIFGIAAVIFVGGIALYFVPTSLILERAGIVNSFKTGFAMTQANFNLVFWLTLASFLFLALAFFLEGSLETLGVLGFVLGRYAGGVVTVYMYVVNPSAYLEIRREK